MSRKSKTNASNQTLTFWLILPLPFSELCQIIVASRKTTPFATQTFPDIVRDRRVDGIDSQAQKQYLAHAPDSNPFGCDEITTKFQDLDVYTKVWS
jgi:hypothetical protein